MCLIINALSIYLCNYLTDKGYYIEKFPKFLERPTDRCDFSYNKIREKIIERVGCDSSVQWADRRLFVNNLNFKKRSDHYSFNDMNLITLCRYHHEMTEKK